MTVYRTPQGMVSELPAGTEYNYVEPEVSLPPMQGRARPEFDLSPAWKPPDTPWQDVKKLGGLVKGAYDYFRAGPPKENLQRYEGPYSAPETVAKGAGHLASAIFDPGVRALQATATAHDPNVDPMTRDMLRRSAAEGGAEFALNMIGVGRLPGAAPAGAVGVGGGQPTLRGAAGEQAWRTGTAEERLRTTNHPFGGGTPIRDMPKPIIEGAPTIKPKQIDVERDLKNAELIFMPGDATGAGGRLLGFPGMTFENPVTRLGGPGYSYAVAGQPGPQRLWASDRGPMAGVFNVAKGVEARGNVPWGVYMTGAKPYMDQSTQMVNTAIEAAKATGVSKAMNDHLVKVMRSDWNVPADKELLFPKEGLNNPSAIQRWLDLQPMPQHSKLVKAMGTAESRKLGFPDIGQLRVGNTDPRLLTAQPGSAGLMLGRIDTSKGLITPSYHPDYNTAIATTGAPYTFGRQLPPNIIAPTMHQQRVEQIRGLKPGMPSAYLNAPHLYYGAGGTAQKTEPVTNQWRDIVQNWQAANPPQKLGGVVLGAGANNARSVGLAAGLNAIRDPQLGSTVRNAPIRAYHSSPHDFDRFDFSKIGTGEGAQAYGHGGYFAENPKVSGQGGQYWQQFKHRFAYNPAEMEAVNVLENHNFNREKAIAELVDARRYDAGYIGGATNSFDRAKREAIVAKNNEALALLQSGKIVGPRTYEVNIHARPEQMLDWDKPLKQQTMVQERIAPLFKDYSLYPANYLGEGAHKEIMDFHMLHGMQPRAAKEATAIDLRSAGIPGIRYLDQGSRNPLIGADMETARRSVARYTEELARDPGNKNKAELLKYWQDEVAKGTPTSNYVIFDPGIIEIAKKYGIPGMLGAGALGSTVAPDRYNRGGT